MQATALYAPLDIAGRTALVTGASSGFGAAIARRLAELGCRLVLVARRLERLEALRDELVEKYRAPVHVARLDVRDLGAVAALPAALPREFAEVVKGMVARNRGHIVNISSVAGQEAYATGGLYCASKHALNAFTTATRHELVGKDIRVTTISPGSCRTEFSVVRFRGDEAAADAVYAGMDPLLADDIADNVAYAVTRPPRVQIADILVYASYQSSARTVARPKLAAAAAAAGGSGAGGGGAGGGGAVAAAK
ncbi:short-chain dehydrogenase reductase [Raphidocelis subcapitata]|uniref:Short-chain dehydrogenase reductase n=1 Tax=Raphidocelis subcapitata TaxID=307507 RepID=A0A2V0P7M8_9CHLO|nr:short-chain dehydrogenase reductase [Raphidocelis subcapitata]|eukprot:GBF95874.1 short-chain dehydrogenase reductase [Raphidocelis subcapitata]